MSATPRRASAPRGPTLRDEKMALRVRCTAARDGIAESDRHRASQAIAARIAGLPAFASAATVLLTLSFRSEWDTMPLIEAALAAGKRVALPRVDLATRMLSLHAIADPVGDVVVGYRGIREPRPGCPPVAREEITFALVPGVAFDTNGARLGYGGGYYDRLLPLLPATATRVAGLFELQIVDRVPMAPHDLGVDFLVTETRVVTCPRSPR